MGTEARQALNRVHRPAQADAPHALAATHRAWASVDLSAVRHNVLLVKRLVGPGAEVAAVVKADAYGHGAVPVGRAAVQAGAAALVVASAREGVELREAGLDSPIIIIGASLPCNAEAIVAFELSAALSPPEMLGALAAEARRRGTRARVHLMADLGMRRVGATPDEALALITRVAATPELELEGIASHFATADGADVAPSREVVAEFERLLAAARAAGLEPRYVHLANSAGVLRLPGSHFNLVRAGIILYGMAGAPLLEGMADWRPALAWRTRVVYVRRVPAGTPVGYGHTYTTTQPTVVATLPVGYHDGFVRAYSSNADVLVRGRRVPVIGRVSMDYTTVDATAVPDVAVGEVATLVGCDGDEEIRAEELARRRGTIPYEVTCAIGPRVQRIHVDTEGTA